MAKQILRILKLQIKGAGATPAPPLGPTLSQFGINIREFCDKFNAQTKQYAGLKVNVIVFVYTDRSFKMQILGPTTTELLKKYAKVSKGSGRPNVQKVGKIKREDLYEIAKIKMPELNTTDLEKAVKIIEGSAKQMGLVVED